MFKIIPMILLLIGALNMADAKPTADTDKYFHVLEKIQQLPDDVQAINPLKPDAIKLILKKFAAQNITLPYKTDNAGNLVDDYDIDVQLYAGDFNNDGHTEYLFLVTGGSMRANTVTSVFKLKNNKLTPLSFPGRGPNFHLWIAKPFAYIKNGMTYVRFMDYPSARQYDPKELAVYVYLWRGSSFKKISHVNGLEYIQ